MATLRENLTNAWKYDDQPWLGPVKASMTRAFAAEDDFRAHQEKVAKNKHLSPIGRQDAMKKHVAEKAHELHRARKAVDVMRAKLADRRVKLLPPPADKTDVANAVLESEMRQFLKSIKNPGERMGLLLSADADPTMLRAVLSAPNVMSGITDQTRELVTNSVIEKNHPGALVQLERASEAVDLAHTVNRVLFDTVRAAAEFPNNDTLIDFVAQSIGPTGALDADVERNFASLAEVA